MQDLVEKLSLLLVDKNLKLVTAESCTGGLLAAMITRRPGASDVLERGFITYSNQSKTDLLHVPQEILENHGAVSAETAEAMAAGALQNSRADIAVSITGIAGPGGGSPDKPVGLVYFGLATQKQIKSFENRFEGTRLEIQKAAARAGMEYVFGETGSL